MNRRSSIRIGTGAGFAGDRIEPAVTLAKQGNIDFIVFECLAERTIALAQLDKLSDPSRGFDPRLVERMEALLPVCRAKRIRIITNSGAANPISGARAIVETARRLGVHGLKVAAVSGDDVLYQLFSVDGEDSLRTRSLAAVKDRAISANAYLGADPIVRALEAGADIVITGRVADPSLFLAPLIHVFGWGADDWNLLGKGIFIGHMMECAGQLTGGYFADPPMKTVRGLADLGFPIAEVSADGEVIFSKVAGTGGLLNAATCKEQLLYEVHDPGNYITPDVVADFSGIEFSEIDANVIRAVGAKGTSRPPQLKVTVAYRDGFIGEGQISYFGSTALSRSRMALEIVAERLESINLPVTDLRCELIGVDAILRSAQPSAIQVPVETRVRVAGRAGNAADAARIGNEVEALYTNGPAGGGGATKNVREVIGVMSVFVPRELVMPTITYEIT